jgi:hypothetical protein
MDDSAHKEPFSRVMTVAHIRERQGAPYCEIVFLESARFYRLHVQNPRYKEILERLREALAQGRPLLVRCSSMESADIEQVESPHFRSSEQ